VHCTESEEEKEKERKRIQEGEKKATPPSAPEATNTLHAILHKYAAALQTALGTEDECGQMVAAFLAAFPPYTIPTSASVPSASVPTNSRDSLTGKKKTHALANAGTIDVQSHSVLHCRQNGELC